MPQMNRASRKQGYGVRDNSNLSASVQASKAASAMFDELTNSFLTIASVATTSAINSKVRESSLEGEMEGVGGSSKTKSKRFSVPVPQSDGTTLYYESDGNGSFKGYDKKTEIFKWDVAANRAAKVSFESNVNARAASSMKTLAKEVDGDKTAYTAVAKRYLSDALLNVDDPQQRQHITNAYAKSYNQNMVGVSTRAYVKGGQANKNAWTDSRAAFKEDVAVVMASHYRAKKEYAKAKLDKDTDAMKAAQEALEKADKELYSLRLTRESEGIGGITYGTLTKDGVAADTAEDIFEGYKSATVELFRTSESYDDKMDVRRQVDAAEMAPNRKAAIMKALDEELSHENAMESARYTKDERDLINNRRIVNESTRTSVIDVWLSHDEMSDDEFDDYQQAIKDGINESWGGGYLTTPERDKYLNLLANGDPVTEDDPQIYATLYANLEEYTMEDITDSEYLTFQSKKELIKAWDDANKNEQWMKSPAYRESKEIIRNAFGFSASDILGEKFTGLKEEKRKEMLRLVEQYRAEVRETVLAGETATHYDIAQKLLKQSRENPYSKIYKGDKPLAGTMNSKYSIEKTAKEANISFDKALDYLEELGGKERGSSGEGDVRRDAHGIILTESAMQRKHRKEKEAADAAKEK